MKKSAIPVYTVKQIKKLEKITQEKLGLSSFQMMQHAAQVLLTTVKKYYTTAHKITIICGSGNNAGEGYLFAQLAIEQGYNIQIVTLAKNNESIETQKAKKQLPIEKNIKISSKLSALKDPCDLIIDALLGIGISRDLSKDYLKAVSLINKNPSPVLSIDIPSGLNANTGNIMRNAIKANHTITFIAHKQGLMTGKAKDYIGQLILSDLGSIQFQSKITATKHFITSIKLHSRSKIAHKGCFGHVLSIGGDHHYAGAAQLAAIAAIRTGAGLVSLATKKSYSKTSHIVHPEIMAYAIKTENEIKKIMDKASVLIIGPGLGQSIWSKKIWDSIKESDKPKIIDADGLNLLAKNPQYSNNWILTPHPGEAARLLNCDVEKILKNRFRAVKKIQKKYGGICVLKGAGSLICQNNTNITINTTGNPGMASGGMGDVLSGIIGALVAQKIPLYQAAQAGVYFHGLAADNASKYHGERGLSASQLLNSIQQVVNI